MKRGSWANVLKYGYGIGFAFTNGKSSKNNPFFYIAGINDNGKKVKIDLSEISSITLIELSSPLFGKDRAKLKIMQFPSISPEALIKEKPNYLTLKQKYTKQMNVWVDLKNKNNLDLCIVGKKSPNEGEIEVIAPLREIKKDTPIFLDYGTFIEEDELFSSEWWVIESVKKDKYYPYGN